MKCQVFFLEKYIFFQIVFVTLTPKKTTHLRRKKLEPFSRWFDVTVKIYILSPFFFPERFVRRIEQFNDISNSSSRFEKVLFTQFMRRTF